MGKSTAKLSRSGGFANDLDKLIEACQYGETHGIPTGNLASRIIAELFMCYFDKEIEKKDLNMLVMLMISPLRILWNQKKRNFRTSELIM